MSSAQRSQTENAPVVQWTPGASSHPFAVLDPETDLTFKIPGSKTKVTDRWHD